LANYYPTNNRSQLTKTANNTVICDFYNANPTSMTAAINNLSSLTATKKIAILGDMFELGEEATTQHKAIISFATTKNFDVLIFIGHHFYDAKAENMSHFFESPEQASKFIKTQSWKDAFILLKGSRGMALEQLLPLL